MALSATHIIGIVLTVGLLLVIGILSGRRVKDARSFAIGGRGNSWMVCGIIMGTLVGGQSTIGTAQMAFCYGLSAWWFTIGAALGAALLALVYAIPLRRSGCVTLTEIIAREYGYTAEGIGSLLCMMGIFISIVSQVLASSAMMTSLSNIPMLWAAVLSAALIALFVFFGGIRSAGLGGLLKVALLYISSIAAAVIVWRLTGGIGNTYSALEKVCETPAVATLNDLGCADDIHQRYANLVGRGLLKDVGSGLSLALGVLATQTYAQGVWAARSYHQARRGVIGAALLVPVIGAACTLVGLYMRGHYITAEEHQALLSAGQTLPEGIGIIKNTAEVFPRFVLDCCPDWVGGIVIGTLFVTVLGGGSGLTLGAVTILVRNVFSHIRKKDGSYLDESKTLYRASIVVMVVMAFVVSQLSHRTLINDLGFLSLGLRATAILLPITAALFFPRRYERRSMTIAMIAGCAVMFIANSLSLPADPIYWGMGVELLIVGTAKLLKRKSFYIEKKK